MSQLNTANVSNPNNYVLGRGKLYFSQISNNLPTWWQDLGNCPNFTINSEEETLEHKSSREGLAVTDKKLTISRTTNIAFDLDELTFDNLAKWFSGDAQQRAFTIQFDGIADEVILGTGAWGANAGEYPNLTTWEFNRWYELYSTAGQRLYYLDSQGVRTVAQGATDLEEGIDYLIDADAGMIMLLDTATTTGFANTAAIDLTVTPATNEDQEIDEVRAFQQGSITGALKFVAINPANNDAVREFQFHQVTLASDGDLSLIGDEFSTMSFTGVVEKNEVADANSPFVTIRGAGLTKDTP